MAETLITLTIIGVIAAMTIPNLVSKYQKHSYVTGLKKAYSTLSNAMALAMHDDEVWVTYPWGYIDPISTSESIIKKYMKVVKTCDSSSQGDCVEVDATGNPIQGYGARDSYIGDMKFFVTADGMTWGSYFSVDVNGKKGPNKWGRDIFSFEVAYTDTYTLAQGAVVPYGSRQCPFGNFCYGYWNNNPSSPLCTTEIVNRDGKNIWGGEAAKCTGRVLEEGAMNY